MRWKGSALNGSADNPNEDDADAFSAGRVRKMVLLDLPVLVRNPQTALKLVGGAKRLGISLRDGSDLEPLLYLRPDDPYHHPVTGEKQRCTSFLIRVRRRKHAAASNNGSASSSASSSTAGPGSSASSAAQPGPDTSDMSATLVAALTTVVRFRSLADFQYLPSGTPLKVDEYVVQRYLHALQIQEPPLPYALRSPTSAPSPTTASSAAAVAPAAAETGSAGSMSAPSAAAVGPWGWGAEAEAVHVRTVDALEHRLNVQPSHFTKVDKPLPYSFRLPAVSQATGALDSGSSLAALRSSGRRNVKTNILAHYTFQEGTPVPSDPVLQEDDDNDVVAVGEAPVSRRLQEAFELRPAWTIVALCVHLGLQLEQFRWKLSAVAYFCRSGAFRSCWLRLGWDPREDRNARIWQPVEMRLSATAAVRTPSRAAGELQLVQMAQRAKAKAHTASSSSSSSSAAAASSTDASDADAGDDKAPYFVWAGGLLLQHSIVQLADVPVSVLQRLSGNSRATTSHAASAAAMDDGEDADVGGSEGNARSLNDDEAQMNDAAQPSASSASASSFSASASASASAAYSAGTNEVLVIDGVKSVAISKQELAERLKLVVPFSPLWSNSAGWLEPSLLLKWRKHLTFAAEQQIERFGPELTAEQKEHLTTLAVAAENARFMKEQSSHTSQSEPSGRRSRGGKTGRRSGSSKGTRGRGRGKGRGGKATVSGQKRKRVSFAGDDFVNDSEESEFDSDDDDDDEDEDSADSSDSGSSSDDEDEDGGSLGESSDEDYGSRRKKKYKAHGKSSRGRSSERGSADPEPAPPPRERLVRAVRTQAEQRLAAMLRAETEGSGDEGEQEDEENETHEKGKKKEKESKARGSAALGPRGRKAGRGGKEDKEDNEDEEEADDPF